MAWTGTGLLVWVTYEFTTRLTGNSSMTLHWQTGLLVETGIVNLVANTVAARQRLHLRSKCHLDWPEGPACRSTGCLPGMGCPAEATGRGFAFDPALAVWREIPSRSVLVRSVPETWTGHAVVVLNQGAEIGTGTRGSSRPVTVPSMTRVGRVAQLPRGPVRDSYDASVAWTGRQLLVWDGGDTYTRAHLLGKS